MILDDNFDKRLESTINLCTPLADWFERNQEAMAYFELVHKGCLHFDGNSLVHHDILTLSHMANAGLTWLETPDFSIKPFDKAFNAAISISTIYEKKKDYLSDTARDLYYINMEELLDEEHTVDCTNIR